MTATNPNLERLAHDPHPVHAVHPALNIPPDWIAEFEAAARRPLATRMRYAFIKTHKPVLDEARFRSFESMAAYRGWCEENLPDWLGYGRV